MVNIKATRSRWVVEDLAMYFHSNYINALVDQSK